MAEIALTKGFVAAVDDADFEWLNQWKWYAQPVKGGLVYARRRHRFGGEVRLIGMHRFIAGDPPGALVDHRDRDTLNNRRENLRLADSRQNNANSTRSPSVTGYRGVRPEKKSSRFRADIRIAGRKVALGWADTPEQAARLYDAAARRAHGEFAVLNFPDEANP